MIKNDLEFTKELKRNENAVKFARKTFGNMLLKIWNTTVDYHEPQNNTFILLSNHCHVVDPCILTIALKKYIRFVASDHLIKLPILGKAITHLGGVIVKYRNNPSNILVDEIIDNTKKGVSVGIYAEGGTTFNGETGFISKHTAELVKNSGVGLITYRFKGGYLRAPRWSSNRRNGQIHAEFVGEYSPDELKKLTVDEIYEIICRDTYVNAYEEQKKTKNLYEGKNLAQFVERVLYICPHCGKIGTLHSKGDLLSCSCGYELTMGSDGFFHKKNKELIFDNVLSWDKWQREVWKSKLLNAKPNEVIYEEYNQCLNTMDNGNKKRISENATIKLFSDRFELICENNIFKVPFNEITKVQTAMKDCLVIVSDSAYFDIDSKVPRSATKYVAAWRYLTKREYI